MRIILALMILGLSSMVLAADEPQVHALMTDEEQAIHMRAKKKLFPGGRDADPLKVQSQLPQVTRKMGPATEAPDEEAAAGAETD